MLKAMYVPENLHQINLLVLRRFYPKKPEQQVPRLDVQLLSGYFLSMFVAREYAGG